MTRVKALLMAFVLVVGGLYIWKLKQEERRLQLKAERRVRIFGHVDPGEIVSIRAVHDNGGYHLKRHPQRKGEFGWSVKDLHGLQASPARVKEIIDVISRLEEKNAVLEKEISSDISEYGLATPELVLSVRDNGQEAVIYFGLKHALSGRRYVRRIGDNRVLLVDENSFESLRKTAFDLWDGRPLKFSVEEVRAIFVSRDDGTKLDFARTTENDQWVVFGERLGYRADQELIEKMLRRLSELRVKEVVGTPAGDLSVYGLAKPKLRLGLRFAEKAVKADTPGSESPPAVIMFIGVSQELPEGPARKLCRYYLRLRGSSVLYGFENPWWRDLSMPQPHFRDKTPFDEIKIDELSIVEFESKSRSESCVLGQETAEGMHRRWSLECATSSNSRPSSQPEKADEGKITTWLEGLLSLNILSYPELSPEEFREASLLKPHYRVKFCTHSPASCMRLLVGGQVSALKPPQRSGRETNDRALMEVGPRFAAVDTGDGELVPGIISMADWMSLEAGSKRFLAKTDE